MMSKPCVQKGRQNYITNTSYFGPSSELEFIYIPRSFILQVRMGNRS
jgi:hypothetical protein